MSNKITKFSYGFHCFPMVSDVFYDVICVFFMIFYNYMFPGLLVNARTMICARMFNDIFDFL